MHSLFLAMIILADDLQKGLRPRRSIRQAMSHEIMFYAIGTCSTRRALVCARPRFACAHSCSLVFVFAVQKEGLGLDKAVEEAKARMSRYSVTVRFVVVDSEAPTTPLVPIPLEADSSFCSCARSPTC